MDQRITTREGISQHAQTPTRGVIPCAPPPPPVFNREETLDIMAILEANVDPEQEEKMRQKALQFKLVCAIEEPNIDKVKDVICEGADMERTILYTKTALTHSLELGQEDVAILLLEEGANPSQGVKHFPFSQPIHLAARKNLTKCLRKLLDVGIDVNTKDGDQSTSLVVASYAGHTETAEILIKNGAKIDATDSCRRTALHRAIENGKFDIAKLLIQNGADLNATDLNLWTPLHLSVIFDEMEIFSVLIEAGCMLDMEDINGQSPLSLACSVLKKKHFDLLIRSQYNNEARKNEYFQGRYVSLIQRSRNACGSLYTVVSLIYSGADVDGSKHQPITIAAEDDLAECVNILLHSGAWIPMNWKFLSGEGRVGDNMTEILDRLRAQVDLQTTLAWQCRRRIRTLLAPTRHLEFNIDKLPLPASMKAYIR